MRNGAVCHAKDRVVEAQHRFAVARQSVADAADAPSDAGDVHATDLARVELDVVDRALEATQRNAALAEQAFERTCASVIGGAVARGRLARIDDSKRRIQVDGVAAGLGQGFRSTASIAEGYVVKVSGLKFTDGTGLATTITVLDAGPILALPKPAKCLFLRFAPVQSIVGPITYFEPEAYEGATGGYSLEQGMKIGVKTSGCAPATRSEYIVQSLELKLHYFDKNMQIHTDYVMAADMDVTDDPAWFPAMATDYAATMNLTWYWRNCSAGVCGPKMQLAKETRLFVLNAVNHYCEAEYSTKVLTLDDQDQVNFQPVHVASLTGFPFTGLTYAEGSQVTFRAETYRVLGSNSSTYPNVETIEAVCSIADGQCAPVPFAVFNHDFYDKPFSGLVTGVTARAGLMWPRVVGTRNGKTFSYSCKVPGVVRDAVNTSTFYRLPFYQGFPAWTMGQGNNGTLTHFGKQQYRLRLQGARVDADSRRARGDRRGPARGPDGEQLLHQRPPVPGRR